MYEDSLGLHIALPILIILISVKLIPRLDPLMEMTVPPLMGPATGLNCMTKFQWYILQLYYLYIETKIIQDDFRQILMH